MFWVGLLCNVPKTFEDQIMTPFGTFSSKHHSSSKEASWIRQASFSLRKPHSPLPTVCPLWTLKPPFLIAPAGNLQQTGSLLPLAA